jgi:8-oxo-dGTP diphosphatase
MSIAPNELRFATIATDVAIFTIEEKKLKVLLIPVNLPPFFDHSHGLPGGLILPNETADDSVLRHLKNKAGIVAPAYMEQFRAFSAIDRDPRGRVVSLAYVAIVSGDHAANIADGAAWYDIDKLPSLAYDHNDVVTYARKRLEEIVEHTTAGRHFLPPKFTLTDLQQIHEIVLGHTIDKRNFRKKILSLGILRAAGEMRHSGRSRPAELYQYSKKTDIAISGLS